MIFSDILKPEIAFDGWAIAIIIFVLSLFCGGAYLIRSKTKISQKQKAGSDSEQEQSVSSSTLKEKNNISQSQKAGDKSKQKQTI